MDKNKNNNQSEFSTQGLPGGKGFKVPEKYFEELPFMVNAKKEVRKTKAVFWFWTGSTITVCLFVLALLVFDNRAEHVDYYTEFVDNQEYDQEYDQEYLDRELSQEDLIDFMIVEEQ